MMGQANKTSITHGPNRTHSTQQIELMGQARQMEQIEHVEHIGLMGQTRRI